MIVLVLRPGLSALWKLLNPGRRIESPAYFRPCADRSILPEQTLRENMFQLSLFWTGSNRAADPGPSASAGVLEARLHRWSGGETKQPLHPLLTRAPSLLTVPKILSSSCQFFRPC